MKQQNSQKAFTLLELLIYLGIFAGVSVAVVSVLVMVARVKPQVDVKAEVQNNMRFALETINQKVSQSVSVDAAQPGYLRLVMAEEAKDPTIFTLQDGTIYMKEGANATTTLTSDKICVESLVFGQVFQPPAPRSISLKIEMSYRTGVSSCNPTGNPLLTFSSTLQQLFPTAQAVTFDSGLFPSTGDKDIGDSTLRWRHGYFSGNLSVSGTAATTYPLQIGASSLVVTSAGNVGIGTTGPQSILHTSGGNGVPSTSGNMNTGVIFSSGSGAPALNLGGYNSGAQA
ncbi:MAG: hypothetical protein Q8L57_00015, partial [bacterium]|nr:hypothetical protein [bacterium]